MLTREVSANHTCDARSKAHAGIGKFAGGCGRYARECKPELLFDAVDIAAIGPIWFRLWKIGGAATLST